MGGVEEVRYQAGRGTLPFKPVTAERQRSAVKFLLERGFTRPDALLDRKRSVAHGCPMARARRCRTPIEALAQAAGGSGRVPPHGRGGEPFPGAAGSYQGIDLLVDLNDGLFLELKQPHPTIDLYRRELQRRYVKRLLSSFSSEEGPSEFKAALRIGIADLANKLDQASKKVRDPQTRAHLKDLRAAIWD